MRMSDWSSDVCSSDLEAPRKTQHQRLAVAVINVARRARNDGFGNAVAAQLPAHARRDVDQQITLELAPHRDKTVIRNTVDAVPVISVVHACAPAAEAVVKQARPRSRDESVQVHAIGPVLDRIFSRRRSEGRRVGKECVGECGTRWWRYT